MLRFEAIVHNTKTLHTCRAVEKVPATVTHPAGRHGRTVLH